MTEIHAEDMAIMFPSFRHVWFVIVEKTEFRMILGN